jgi:adenosine deaminase
MEEFIRKIPKILLHVHLEGTLQPELCFKLAKRNNIKIPYESIEDIWPDYPSDEDFFYNDEDE